VLCTSALSTSTFIVPDDGFSLKPKQIAQYLIRHRKGVVVIDCHATPFVIFLSQQNVACK